VRKLFAVLALAASVSTSAQAQQAWQKEIGIQGGFTRLVAPGTGGDPVDVVSLPGFNLGPLLPLAPALYAVIPWKNKIAIEVDVAATQLTSGGSATLVTLGVRGDYALTKRFYAAAGGALGYMSNTGTGETQLAVQAAVGYRHRLVGALNGRVEVGARLWGKSANIGPQNTYSVLFGVSTPTRGGSAARGTQRGAAAGAWTKQLGVAGGYASVHEVGGANDATFLVFPSFGSAFAAVGAPELSLPSTIFAIFPIGKKMALEPGVDIHRIQSSGTTTFAGTVSARLNYAVHGGWYGAAGATLQYLKGTGADAATRTALNLAWGYRFALTGPLGGRVEANYTLWGRNTDLVIAPVNTFGLMFGVLVPLR
jgi:hypothetical protein